MQNTSCLEKKKLKNQASRPQHCHDIHRGLHDAVSVLLPELQPFDIGPKR